MDRWFVYFAVRKPPLLGLEAFDVRVLAPTLAKIWIAADIQQDQVDLDRSALFDVGTQEAADDFRRGCPALPCPVWGRRILRAVGVFSDAAAPWPLGRVSKAAGGPFGRVLGTSLGLDVDAACGM